MAVWVRSERHCHLTLVGGRQGRASISRQQTLSACWPFKAREAERKGATIDRETSNLTVSRVRSPPSHPSARTAESALPLQTSSAFCLLTQVPGLPCQDGGRRSGLGLPIPPTPCAARASAVGQVLPALLWGLAEPRLLPVGPLPQGCTDQAPLMSQAMGCFSACDPQQPTKAPL